MLAANYPGKPYPGFTYDFGFLEISVVDSTASSDAATVELQSFISISVNDSTTISDTGSISGCYRPITIDHTKVGLSDSTNYVFLFTGTFNGTGGTLDLRSVSNGGSVAQANGYDIAFYADSGLTTLLNYERVSWDGSTGAVEFYVQIPTLSSSVDTVIYITYGNASATDISNKNATWRSEFKSVWHMQESSGDMADSTSSNHTLTDNGSSSVTVKNGLGRELTSGSGNFLSSSDSADWNFGSGDFTVIWWYSRSGGGKGAVNRSTAGVAPFFFAYNYNDCYISSNGSSFDIDGGTGFGTNFDDNLSSYYRIAVTRIGNDFFFYKNGSQVNTVNSSLAIQDVTSPLLIGKGQGGGFQTMRVDEFYLAKGLGISSSWITADYNNQNDPSSFFSVGNETCLSGSAITIMLISNISVVDSTDPVDNDIVSIPQYLISINDSITISENVTIAIIEGIGIFVTDSSIITEEASLSVLADIFISVSDSTSISKDSARVIIVSITPPRNRERFNKLPYRLRHRIHIGR